IQRISSTTKFSERGDHDLNPGFRPDSPLRAAAVLVGLVDHGDGLTMLLTQRTDHLQHHPGQVSFPGGHIEDDDADAVAAALRETEEETGLAASHIDVLGRLDTYITRTGFEITPVVALIKPPFSLSPDPHEVAEVFEVPLSFLMNPDNHQRLSREFEGTKRYFYAMPYRNYHIWGATAGMIMDLYQILTGATALHNPGIDETALSC
ncbi:MAG: CoA pyrophosphatase, partial [Magnetovibrio sp.]|nr:CoA pyrophosphatase [Magnetovibrio sp.]